MTKCFYAKQVQSQIQLDYVVVLMFNFVSFSPSDDAPAHGRQEAQ